jgi:hypothetical protein
MSPELRAVAAIWTFNEEDFIAWSVRHLLAQGIDVHVFDNWSTDRTFELLQGFGERIRAERWPARPETCSSLTSRLMYLERYALETPYDWIIHHDADEIRRAPTGETLIEFIRRVDRQGYNAIDHVAETYLPKEGWDGSRDPETFFDRRLPRSFDERSVHIKAWKRQQPVPFTFNVEDKSGQALRGQALGVNLWATGGHEVLFLNRNVAPEKLVLKHYPLRTQAHAERKVAERTKSYAPDELSWGWHVQYRTPWWK